MKEVREYFVCGNCGYKHYAPDRWDFDCYAAYSDALASYEADKEVTTCCSQCW